MKARPWHRQRRCQAGPRNPKGTRGQQEATRAWGSFVEAGRGQRVGQGTTCPVWTQLVRRPMGHSSQSGGAQDHLIPGTGVGGPFSPRFPGDFHRQVGQAASQRCGLGPGRGRVHLYQMQSRRPGALGHHSQDLAFLPFPAAGLCSPAT